MATAGECGEVCNAVKKLRRLADGTNTAKDPQTEAEAIIQIGKELADMIIYADLLAARLNINLSSAIVSKFNEVSDRMKCAVKIEPEGDYDEWFRELRRIAFLNGFSPDSIETFDKEAWRSYFGDGNTPAQALFEEISCA